MNVYAYRILTAAMRPLTSAGVNASCRAARIAASSKRAPPDSSTLASFTEPSVPMVTARTTVAPCSSPAGNSGWTGCTSTGAFVSFTAAFPSLLGVAPEGVPSCALAEPAANVAATTSRRTTDALITAR